MPHADTPHSDAHAHRRPLPAHRAGWRGGLSRFKHSISLRLIALFVLLAVATTLVFVAGTRQAFNNGWRSVVQPLLTDYVDHLAAEVGSPPDTAAALAITQRLPIAIDIDGPVVHWSSHPDSVPPAGPAERRLRHHPPGAPRMPGIPGMPHDPRLRGLLTRTTADGHRLHFRIGELSWDEERPRRIGWITLTVLLALTALAYAYVRHLFKPLKDIRAGTERYSAGQFDTPIPQRHHDELGELAGQVNRMAGSLSGMLEHQRGLLLAISHELRSPLTRARLNAEMVADGPERDGLLRDLSEMRDLISDLLESERLAGGSAALQKVPTDLNELIRTQCAESAASSALQLKPLCSLHLGADLPALPADSVRLRLLVRNLLDNAQRHGGSATPPEIHTRATADGGWELEVRDHGPGVPDDQLTQLGQPFYRADAARTRRSGGVGLGLYLCRMVAQSHGGTLTLRHASPGLAVTVRLPASKA